MIAAPMLAEAADPQLELRRNPFERPVLEELTASTLTRSSVAKAADDPGLRAVLVAGSKSSVNFGGVIIQIGETTNGYLLLSVEEGSAVFSNKGKKVAFSLYEQAKGDER
ncbi:MAG: hypothetical protein O7F72_05225 [Proteobacteria bacterium]|nr:hypothetical protein [Pseudomonadota bacterium]